MTQPQPLDLNLLPERYQRSKIVWWQIALVLFVAALLVGLLPTYLVYQQTRQAGNAAQEDLNAMLATVKQSGVTQEELDAVAQQISAAQTRLSLLQEESDFVEQWQEPRAPNINAAVETLLPEITLNTLSQAERVLTLQGHTLSQALVLDYARALQTTAEFANVRIARMEDVNPPDAPPSVQFVIMAED